MKILIDGYIDKNLGDDLMMYLAAGRLRGHKIYMDNTASLPVAALDADGVKPDLRLTVTGSGFLLYNYKTALLRAGELLRDRAKCKRAVLSCNISDFPNRFAERVIKKQLSRYDFITVRDKYSYEYIKSELPRIDCEYYPDIVFSLPKEAITDKPCEGALGISAYGLADKAANERLAKIADEFTDKTGNRVLLFALDIGSENDLGAAKMIKGIMKHGDMAEIIKHDAMLRNIKRCEKLIGIRFHSAVISLMAGVPLIPLTYSNKTERMLTDIGFDGDIFSLNDDFGGIHDEVFTDLKPFKLNEKITADASKHIKRLCDHIIEWKGQKKG